MLYYPFILKDKIFKFYGTVMNFYCSFSVTAADAEILRCSTILLLALLLALIMGYACTESANLPYAIQLQHNRYDMVIW
jgi:hypothetical protein